MFILAGLWLLADILTLPVDSISMILLIKMHISAVLNIGENLQEIASWGL